MIPAWTEGYTSDVSYTLGFYRELAPGFLRFACYVSGVEGPQLRPGLRYCELGCGRGYGTLLLAAANPGIEFVAIDFNPAHIAEAQALARKAALPNVTFHEMSFADAARSTDPTLASFDVVALHGIYTWVDRKVRDQIHDFIRAKLVPGGTAFVSYNALPGWAPIMPVQRIFQETASRTAGDSIALIVKGQETLKTLVENASGFVKVNPVLKDRLARMENQDKHYLVHEYLHNGWEPLYVTDVMNALSEAKVTYAGSASIAENRIEFCVPEKLRKLVTDAPDPGMRELLKDYAINKQFRRDIYVKGPLALSARERIRRLAETRFALLVNAGEVPEKIRLPFGEATPQKPLMEALLVALDKGPALGAELFAAGEKVKAPGNAVPLMLEILVHGGLLSPAVQAPDKAERAASDRLNAVVMEGTLAADTHRFLASPVLGSAIAASFLDRIIAPVLAANPRATDLALADQVFGRVKAGGQSLMREGKPMQRDQESLATIAKSIKEFRDKRFGLWQRLRIL